MALDMLFGTRRWGFTIPIVGLASLAFAQMCCDAVLGDGYYTANDWPKLVGSAFSGLVLWIYGNRLNPIVETVEIRDGNRIVHSERSEKNTFMHIPAQYWGWIMLALGSFIAVTGQ